MLDGQTLLNLEIFQNTLDNSDRGTLFKLLNHTCTPFGKRIFKKWVCHPLNSIPDINARLDAIDDLNNIAGVMSDTQKRLKKLPDIERIIARIHTGTCKVKDFVSCLAALEQIQAIHAQFTPFTNDFKSYRLRALVANRLPKELLDALAYFRDAFDHQDAATTGNIQLHHGYDQEFDAHHDLVNSIEGKFKKYLSECRREVDCKSMVFKDLGKEIFQIEVPVKTKVPNEWTSMSKTQAVNRYYTPTIRKLVAEMLEAREHCEAAMRNIKLVMFLKFDERYKEWMDVIRALGELDCLLSLATCRRDMDGIVRLIIRACVQA